jgi:hypothetical protein
MNLNEEAKNCKDCLGWHKHCNAECCKIIFLNIKDEDYRKSFRFVDIMLGEKLSLDKQIYYKLRGVEYLRNRLRFKKKRIIKVNGEYIYQRKCKALHNCLCLKHPDMKPKLCMDLTFETSKEKNKGFKLTQNCLFKYK